jgi:NAD(P)-dependent dehydrogenase (short-subunit alcohol dehydrogenase family)
MTDRDVFSLAGRVAVVSGGGGAIGSALAAGLARAGASVAVVDADAGSADRSAAAVRSLGSHSVAITADMTQEAEAERAISQVVAQYHRLDILVNAVGGGAGKALHPAEAYPSSAWDWIFALNLRTTVIATQTAVRAMISAGHGGRVLSVSSVRGQLGIDAGYSAYVGAKGAINSLTRQWATEWAKHGITVNAIAPTFVDTPQVADLLADAQFKANLLARVPLKRVGQTSDLIGALLLFCSDASSFITGQVLTIDGGLTATQ